MRLTTTADTPIGILIVATDTEAAMLVVTFEPDLHDRNPGSSTGCEV